MMLLSLDQALNTTGWAIFDNNKLIENDSFNIKATAPIEVRLGSFWKKLNSLYEKYNFDYLVFEDIQNQNNNETYKKLAYCQATIYLWCYFKEIKCSVMAPSHWRSVLDYSFGRKREEQKKAAMNLVKEKCGLSVSSDEADAICIGLAYLQETSKNKSAF